MLLRSVITQDRPLEKGFAAWFWVSVLLVFSHCSFPTPSKAASREETRFRRILEGKNDAARVAAIQSVSKGFQIRAEALPIVAKSLLKLSRDPRFRRAEKRGIPNLPDGVALMIEFVGTVETSEATDTLVELLDCGHLYWVMASVNSLCKNRHHSAIDPISQLLTCEHFDASYGFRFTLARGLRQMRHPKAWEALAQLYDLVDGQLAHRCREEFAAVTVEEFEGDTQRFNTWRGRVGLDAPEEKKEEVLPQEKELAMPKKLTLAPSKSAASYVHKRKLSPSKYYGIDIFARRLLFVLDRSGSMNNQVYSRTRLQRAKQELTNAITGLDERCDFGILIFDTDVRAWKETLIEATDENKTEAIRFVQRLTAGRSTNTYGALRTSIEFDDQLEAIFVLTDGEPTTGMITNPTTILQDILRRNEARHITINTIAIAVDPLIEGFLRKLTIPSQGEFKSVR